MARPIRELITYLGLEYKDIHYGSFPEWAKDKEEFIKNGHHFANLPYVKDGDNYVSESSAIPVYLISKAN